MSGNEPPITSDYAAVWFDENSDLAEDEILALDRACLSLDLQDATYNIPFDILDENVRFMDKTLQKFPPWYTFRSMFASHEREVDMSDLIDQGYWAGEEIVISKAGSFMGDGLSFLHLTLYLAGVVRAATSCKGIPRPLGQSVGDDLFLLNLNLAVSLDILSMLHRTGAKFSKINAICKDALTFCENYVARTTDSELFEEITSFLNSIFGDLSFLDTIKGSTLTGRSKVKADGAKPFIGHAQLLSKQLSWHPIDFVKNRAKILLWCRNHREAVKLSSNMASLPVSLGGIELILGPQIDDGSRFWQEHAAYYETLLGEPQSEFLKYYTMLQGIYRANPKGYDWSNDFNTISDIIDDIQVIELTSFDDYIPQSQSDRPFQWKVRYMKENHGLITVRSLSTLLARQEAFMKQWNGEKPRSFLTLYDKNAKRRANASWALIKSNKQPTVRLRHRTIKQMADAFSVRTEGLFVKINDPAISSAFEGIPTLEVDYEPSLFG
jgi:hypothetical protein